MNEDADSSYPECQVENKDKDNEKPVNAIYRILFQGKSGAWTAVATVAMCIFSYFLWQVSNESNENNIASQRATLSSNGPNWGKIMSQDGKTVTGYTIGYAMANSGSLPAKDASGQVNLSIGSDRPGDVKDFAKLPQSQTVNFIVGPKGAIVLPQVSFSIADAEEVAAGRKHMFVWGWTVYHDGFSKTPTRLTEFCTDFTQVNWTSPDHTSPQSVVMALSPPCEKHNCYDEDCPDYKTKTE
jgi:hypothetical protein